VHVRNGAPLPYACPAAGLPWNTAKDWNKRAREGKEPYATVWGPAIAKAKADHVATCIREIAEQGGKDWKAHAWLLERRYKEFMKPEHRKVELTGKDGGPIAIDSVSRMSDAQLAAALAEADDAG
jgi:hypothetical protein